LVNLDADSGDGGRAPTSIYRQGDLQHYTTLRMLQRISNSLHLDVLNGIKRFWDALELSGTGSGPHAPGVGVLGKVEYCRIMLLLHKQLMPNTSADQAVRIVMEDWRRDSLQWGVSLNQLEA